MKTKHIFLLGMSALLFIPQLSAQGFSGKTRWVMGLGMQEQDRRMYDWPNSTNLLERANHIPTWTFGIGIAKPILYKPDLSIDLGLNYAVEINSFPRPYNKAPFLGAGDPQIVSTAGVYVGKYYIHSLGPSFHYSKKIIEWDKNSCLVFTFGALSSFHFLKWMRRKNVVGIFPESNEKKYLIAPYSLEIIPGIGYQNGPFRTTVNYRLWQIKQVDPVLFVPGLYQTLPNDPYETYNPFKMWITVSRDLEAGWWKGKRGK